MGKYTKEDILKKVKEDDVEFWDEDKVIQLYFI